MMEKLSLPKKIIAGLTWGPVCQALEAHILRGDSLLLVISPFIGLDALKRFFQAAGPLAGIKVIVRWRPEDVLAGVSDIAIYPYLAERGIPLYVNQNIHLKLYVCESNTAFSTSGNLTLRGFGYSEKRNIEVGSFIHLNSEDWSRIYELINTSTQVDEDIFQRYKRYVESCPKVVAPVTPPPDLLGTRKVYTISSLPAMETPIKLSEYYFAPDTAEHTAEEIRRAAHDLVAFGVPPKLSQTDLNQRLHNSFRGSPFVVDFVDVLRREKSLRFGAVNDWIHQKCEDVPLPYRWEIKENTRIFYNWLQHFFPEIAWDRPNYSQVIYWRGQ